MAYVAGTPLTAAFPVINALVPPAIEVVLMKSTLRHLIFVFVLGSTIEHVPEVVPALFFALRSNDRVPPCAVLIVPLPVAAAWRSYSYAALDELVPVRPKEPRP